MEDRIELKDHNKIPLLGFGTWQLEGERCVKATKTAIALGYPHIDTAKIYGNEQEVGKAITESDILRDELFITSKLWHLDNPGYDDVISACEESLNRLNTDYLNLYLLHWPNRNLDMREILKAFKKLKEMDKVASVGVSNFTINHLKELLPLAEEVGVDIAVNQVEFHPYLNQEELLDFCEENGIKLTAYSPLARGKVLEDPVICEIAKKHDVDPANVVLSWETKKGLIVIPKSSSEEHIKSNMKIDVDLSEEEIKRIDGLNKNQREVNPSFSEFDY